MSQAPRRRFQSLSVRAKIFALIALSIGFVLGTGLIGLVQLNKAAAISEEITQMQKLTRTALEGDMGHDASRGDVLRAVLGGTGADAEEIRGDLDAHTSVLADAVELFAGADMPTSVREAALAVQPVVENYNNICKEITEIALASEPSTTDAAPMDAAFGEVEELMPAIGDALEEASAAKVAEANAAQRAGTVWVIGFGVAAALLVTLGGVLFARDILGALEKVSLLARGLAAGNLKARVDINRDDELGRMAGSLNEAMASLQGLMSEVAAAGTSLGAAAQQLRGNADSAAAGAEEAAMKSNTARSSVGDVDSSVQAVMAGAEQLSAAVAEIATNASNAADVAQESVVAVQAANGQITQLGEASAEIGGVVKLITAIAEQTNLLALNATIEAARAGEAGKGFAVVAEEVKQLAQETARATGDITERIQALQTASVSAAESIEGIQAVIGQINEFNLTIASAVEEQAATTSEMAGTLSDAARASAELSGAVDEVATANATASEGIDESRDAAANVAALSAQLTSRVGSFQY